MGDEFEEEEVPDTDDEPGGPSSDEFEVDVLSDSDPDSEALDSDSVLANNTGQGHGLPENSTAPWSREEDREILVAVKSRGASQQTFQWLSKHPLLRKKAVQAIEERYRMLVELFHASQQKA